ncbi:hypothetical protein [Thermoanaerobacterium sp. DL9XJH110]|uniref:prenylated flavin chaperone LpdD n=1 Tax=Thermoanaerobacterium sp. DL9XJH110 TaxID=3386643 RepID=UPI003BB766FF
MKEVFVETIGEGRLNLKAVVTVVPEGVNIYLGGGEKPHIGTVVISQPRQSLKCDGSISCTTSVFNLLGHKDDGIAIPLAEEICKKLNRLVVVTAGVHIENATIEDIERLKNSGRLLTDMILSHFIKK